MSTSTVKLCGVLIVVGGLAWSAAWLITGPPPEGVNRPLEIWASGVFQIGLVALLAVLRVTDATGRSRWGRAIINIELFLLALAIGWTIPHLWQANRPHDTLWINILDAGWPLSMAWLIVVGIAVVRARRWPSPARWLPLAASLLLPVDIAFLWTGEWPSLIIRAGYLAVAYTALGWIVIRDIAPLTARIHQNQDSTRIPA
ncbi:MAG: hypothetical protein M3O70_17665 [Actinomycetota bacterium]|nr:hypothetical protein [Actinomycetota bacterium]